MGRIVIVLVPAAVASLGPGVLASQIDDRPDGLFCLKLKMEKGNESGE